MFVKYSLVKTSHGITVKLLEKICGILEGFYSLITTSFPSDPGRTRKVQGTYSISLYSDNMTFCSEAHLLALSVCDDAPHLWHLKTLRGRNAGFPWIIFLGGSVDREGTYNSSTVILISHLRFPQTLLFEFPLPILYAGYNSMLYSSLSLCLSDEKSFFLI